MGTIERYKKLEGFRKLILFLEDTADDKQKKIIEFMRNEDAKFVAELEKYLFHFEEFEKIDDLIVCEIISDLKDISTLAFALYKCPNESLVQKFVKNIPPNKQIKYKQELDFLDKVSTRQQQSARMIIIKQARKLETENKIQLKYCPRTYEESPQ